MFNDDIMTEVTLKNRMSLCKVEMISMIEMIKKVRAHYWKCHAVLLNPMTQSRSGAVVLLPPSRSDLSGHITQRKCQFPIFTDTAAI